MLNVLASKLAPPTKAPSTSSHAIQQPTVGERCRGYADGLGIDLGDAMMDSGTDPAEIKNKVMAYLSANPDVDGILTLGPVSADPTIAALDEMGLAGDIHFGYRFKVVNMETGKFRTADPVQGKFDILCCNGCAV